MASKEKILVVYGIRAPFTAKDISLYAKRLDVVEYQFNIQNKYLLPFEFIKQFFYLLFNTYKFNYINIQIAGFYSVLPALFGKLFKVKTIVMAGGSDCFSFPSFKYGNLRSPLLKWATIKSYQWADLIMPVHESLIYQDFSYYPVDYPAQGIKYFLPKVKTPVFTVYNGYNIATWKLLGLPRKKNSFITVSGGLDTRNNYIRKGVDLIEEIAPFFPDCTFTIVGAPKDSGIGKGIANIVPIEFLDNSLLPELMNKNEFYLQLSIAEGFPNALCEGMACGCIPLGSSVSAIPFIIGDSGFILKERNLELLKQLIQEALRADNKEELSLKAHKRIADNFAEINREEGLFAALTA